MYKKKWIYTIMTGSAQWNQVVSRYRVRKKHTDRQGCKERVETRQQQRERWSIPCLYFSGYNHWLVASALCGAKQ